MAAMLTPAARGRTPRPCPPSPGARSGASGYAPINLTPGKYAYMCFFPEGGKKNGKPHFMLGMEGTVTVS